MITAIKNPSNPLLPPAANQLFVADSWPNALGGVPVFDTVLQHVDGKTVIGLGGESVAMTREQWDKWPADADDEEYILNAVCANRGLIRA